MKKEFFSDVEQSLLNEYRKIGRALEQRKRTISEIEQRFGNVGSLPLRRRPKRYSAEFDFVPGDLQPQTRSFFVDGGSRFYASGLESAFRVSGEAAVSDGGGGFLAGQAVTATLPWGLSTTITASNRQAYFDFFWQIRDTGSDREWQNLPQPAIFLLSGSLSPMLLPVMGKIRGGSEVFITVDPYRSAVAPVVGARLFQTVSSYTVILSFLGEEVVS